jgi:thioredoxin 1
MKLHANMAAAITCCLFLASLSCGYAQGPFDTHHDAEQDFVAAKTRAATEHKRVLLDFGANWCGPCVTLDKLFDSNHGVRRSLDAGFILVKVPIEIQNDPIGTKHIRQQYPPFSVVPHLLVVDARGKQLWDQPNDPLMSDLTKGEWNPEAVLVFLNQWGGKR